MAGFQPYLEDPSIENINANGADEVFVRYADGTREQVDPVASSDAELVELVRTLAARVGPRRAPLRPGLPSTQPAAPRRQSAVRGDGGNRSALRIHPPSPVL